MAPFWTWKLSSGSSKRTSAPDTKFYLGLTSDSYIYQYEEEYNSIKKERRPGRPSSSKEDLLKIKIAALKEEHEKGFREFSLN
jgi:Translation machinery-associated protein 16